MHSTDCLVTACIWVKCAMCRTKCIQLLVQRAAVRFFRCTHFVKHTNSIELFDSMRIEETSRQLFVAVQWEKKKKKNESWLLGLTITRLQGIHILISRYTLNAWSAVERVKSYYFLDNLTWRGFGGDVTTVNVQVEWIWLAIKSWHETRDIHIFGMLMEVIFKDLPSLGVLRYSSKAILELVEHKSQEFAPPSIAL